MPEPMTETDLAAIRKRAKPGYATSLVQLVTDAQVPHPLADVLDDVPAGSSAIVHGCVVHGADALRQAVRVVWRGVPKLLEEVERLRAALQVADEVEADLAAKLDAVRQIEPTLRRIFRDGTRSELELVDAVEVLVRQALDTTEGANDAM